MPNVLALVGPTAVGKTSLSISLATILEGEIISCDSMQIYKYMNLGTAKPSHQERASVPHHMIDVVSPMDSYSVARYQESVLCTLDDIWQRRRFPMIVGGTGLYLNSILYTMDFAGEKGDPIMRDHWLQIAKSSGNLVLHQMLRDKDPATADRIHPNNVKRVVRALETLTLTGKSTEDFCSGSQSPRTGLDPLLVGLTRNREELNQRIDLRVDAMMSAGLVQEVESLLNMGCSESLLAMQGIGYKEVIEYLHGQASYEETVEKIKINTRRYGKRQGTWFRRYPEMKWINLSEATESEAQERIIKWVKEKR